MDHTHSHNTINKNTRKTNNIYLRTLFSSAPVVKVQHFDRLKLPPQRERTVQDLPRIKKNFSR